MVACGAAEDMHAWEQRPDNDKLPEYPRLLYHICSGASRNILIQKNDFVCFL